MQYLTVWARAQDTQWAPAGKLDYGSAGFIFRYTEAWLASPSAYSLDPVHLPLSPANFYAKDHQQLLPLFTHLIPSGWFETIFNQHFKAKSDQKVSQLLKNIPQAFTHIRLTQQDKPLESIELAAWEEMEDYFALFNQHPAQNWPLAKVKHLLIGGCWKGAQAKISLQGAPHTWLAKWQSPEDEFCLPLLEYACLQLLHEANFAVPARHLIPLPTSQWAYLVERFDLDRGNPGYFLTADIVLGRGSSVVPATLEENYTAFARCLRKYSSRAKDDLADLFRRLIANIVLNNRDDFSRKLGLFYQVKTRQWRICPVLGWRPALPSAATGPVLGSLAGALNCCNEFGLNNKQAQRLVDELLLALQAWDNIFEHAGVSGRVRRMVAQEVTLLST